MAVVHGIVVTMVRSRTADDREAVHGKRANVLGIGVSAIDMREALTAIDGWVRTRAREYVCVATVHSVMEARRNPRLLSAVNASGLTTPDGVPLVWFGRLAGFRHIRRVYGPDLMLESCGRFVSQGYRHYFYGGGVGVAEELARVLAARFTGLVVAGASSPPYGEVGTSPDQAAVSAINAARPDILWIGLGAPKQELWMAAHRRSLEVPVMIGVGAAFDFHTGLKKQAPRWMRGVGLEWLYRLIQEPRRLWKRYLMNNPTFLLLAVGQLTGLYRPPIPVTDRERDPKQNAPEGHPQ